MVSGIAVCGGGGGVGVAGRNNVGCREWVEEKRFATTCQNGMDDERWR